jgi:hypothetical protein
MAGDVKFDDGGRAYRDFPKFVGNGPGAKWPMLNTSLLDCCLCAQHVTGLTTRTLLPGLYTHLW